MSGNTAFWRRADFQLYLSSTAFTGIAFAMQQLLLAWILIGILELPATQVGLIQATVGIPGIFLMLLGGAKADGVDPRALLIKVYLLAPLFPLFLIAVVFFEQLSVLSVLLWALCMSIVISYSSPAQQAILNRVAGEDLQKAVSAATAISFIVQIIGLAVAGTMEVIGLIPVLLFQLACIVLGAVTIKRLAPGESASSSTESTREKLIAGFKAVYRDKVILETLVINFTSSIFNAGAFMTVIPFVVRRIYDGDALTLSLLMVVFYTGATTSNFIMIRLMPLLRPGRIFLLMQLSRGVILAVMWIQPSFLIFALAAIAWGFNMGVTLTLARTIVQESASAGFRGRIMSVYRLGLLGSAPIGALVLGWIIEVFGTLNGLLPAIAISVVLFVYGVFFSPVYNYQSQSKPQP